MSPVTRTRSTDAVASRAGMGWRIAPPWSGCLERRVVA
jgi:hypothetical protein